MIKIISFMKKTLKNIGDHLSAPYQTYQLWLNATSEEFGLANVSKEAPVLLTMNRKSGKFCVFASVKDSLFKPYLMKNVFMEFNRYGRPFRKMTYSGVWERDFFKGGHLFSLSVCLSACLSLSLSSFYFFLSSQLYLFESRFYIGSNSAHDVWEVWDGDMISPGIRNKLLLYLL